MQEYIDLFCQRNNVNYKELTGSSRKKSIMLFRHVLFYILFVNFNYGATAIGKSLNRNHGTVLHGVKKISIEKDLYDDVKMLLINSCEDFS